MTHRRALLLLALLFTLAWLTSRLHAADFERDIRPLLAARCVNCHGPERQRGSLRLDSPEGIRQGGSSGPIVVAGKSAASSLMHHITAAQGATRMPPKGDPLTSEQIALLRTWIDGGAPLPDARTVSSASKGPRRPPLWAPLQRPALPTLPTHLAPLVRTPIDTFILARLHAAGLNPAPLADRRILARRLYLDLTGLPPLPEEMNAFLTDSAPDAYERLVDRLLASPRYGERWARHWLDVAHYADSHGQDQDRPRPNAWPYRDYLIRSFNADKPYRRFVREQIAGDVLYPQDPDAVVATGFLAAGPWDESGLRDIREDSIDRQIARYLDRDDIVTTTLTTFVGMTVHCARCHDHKFDPITQEDYYALQSIFAGIDKAERLYDRDPQVAQRRQALQADLTLLRSLKDTADPRLHTLEMQHEVLTFEQQLRGREKQWTMAVPQSVRSAQGASLQLLPDQSILSTGKRPDKDTYSVEFTAAEEKLTGLRLEVLCHDSLPHKGPGRQDNGNLHLSEIRLSAHPVGKPGETVAVKIRQATADFDQQDWAIHRAIDGNPATAWGIYPAVGQSHQAVFEFEQPVGFAGGTVFTVQLDQLHGGGHLLGRFRLAVTSSKPGPALRPLPEPIAGLLDIPEANRTPTQRGQLAQWVRVQKLEQQRSALPAPSRIYCGTNQFAADGSFRPAAQPRPVHILQRGEVTRPGKLAVPGAVAALMPVTPARFALRQPDEEGQRRAALADWLSSDNNPLTWRVLVNRVWHYHFGRGLVDTPNDLGNMGGAVTHPELLDWLAVEFRDGGGSLKQLHRQMLLSHVYRQSSRHDPVAASRDGDNRLLWRMQRGRLDAETVRDAQLLLSGRLDHTQFGPPVMHFLMKPGIHVTPEADYDRFDVDSPGASRRSIYRFLFRTRPDPLLEALDCPDASQSAPVRAVSINALQALVLWNNKFTLRQAEHLASLAQQTAPSGAAQMHWLAERVLSRPATDAEVAAWSAHVQHHGLTSLCRVLLNSSEFLFID